MGKKAKELSKEDMERVVKMCVAMSQQEGSPKGKLEINKKFLSYYDHMELEVVDNGEHFTVYTKMK